MTTLAALSTKDALIMGCDSLGSVTREFVDTFEAYQKYFDADGKLKIDSSGNPVLNNISNLLDIAKSVPYNHMPHITKMFSLEPLEMGVMMTGITSVGERTVSSLMDEFTANKQYFNPNLTNYTVGKTAERLRDFICSHYDQLYSNNHYKPVLELIIGGYDKQDHLPTVYRIKIGTDEEDERIKKEIEPGQFFPIFGGQRSEIERIVKGTDYNNKIRIIIRIQELIEKYRSLISDYLQQNNITIELPGFDDYSQDFFPYDNWDLTWFDASWGDFSEQNAIDCVNFFIEIMINSQQFSSRMPTVGGPVHIALIKKGSGFRFVSKEEYSHEGHLTPKIKREGGNA